MGIGFLLCITDLAALFDRTTTAHPPITEAVHVFFI
jgi:hypothetical protein